ncbi:MAG: NAD-dependent epimerase/dehydratase family protein [Gemmatimonadaceae bacterium]
MTRVVVTGARGFIGRHVMLAFAARPGTEVCGLDIDDDPSVLARAVADADVIVHLAGVNRPTDEADFARGNADLTAKVCEFAEHAGRHPLLILASSIHATGDTPYGASKRRAEDAVAEFAARGGGAGVVLRMSNVFGKWSRPHYNSAVATFCYSIARGLPVAVSDPARDVALVYIDDVVATMLEIIDAPPARGTCDWREPGPVVPVPLSRLVAHLEAFRDMRTTLVVPDFRDDFTRKLYATYLSFLPGESFSYALETRVDPRGALAEFIKGEAFGQIFVSRTSPGITRGNHYHHTKTEKFLVVEGNAVVRFRQLESETVIEHHVTGQEFRVVDIPPGYTHSIENVGTGEMVCLFWASEPFDPTHPDTLMEPVLRG